MELQQLRYFIEVVNTGNITKAAKKLSIVQPALSQSIKRLEDELGTELFIRRGRRIHISPIGEVFFREVSPIVTKLNSLPSLMSEIAGTEKKTLRIGLVSASKLMTDVIIKYKEDRPDINFIVSQSPEGEKDIMVTSRIYREVTPPEDAGRILFGEEMFLAVPLEWADDFEEPVMLKDFANYDFISMDYSKPYKTLCDGFLHDVGIEPIIAYSSDNPASVRDLISAGLGVAFWPQFSWGEIHTDRVKLLHIKEPVCRRTISISMSPGAGKEEAAADFFSFIKRYFDELFPGWDEPDM